MFDSTPNPHSNPLSANAKPSTTPNHRRHSSQTNASCQPAGEIREGQRNSIDIPSHTPSPRRSTKDRRLSGTALPSTAHSNGSPSKRHSASSRRLSASKASPPPVPTLTFDTASTSTVGAPATPGLITPGGRAEIAPDYFAPPIVSVHRQSPTKSPKKPALPGSTFLARGGGSPTPTEDRGGREGGLRGEDTMSGKRHSISRSQDATAENRRLGETEGSDSARAKDRREQDKKTMLSKALQKAHTAVLLDNAQNFEGAIEAYSDACRLLQHVLLRSTGEEDRRKLDAIRTTYTNRITELRQLYAESQVTTGKSLPRPPSSDSSPAMPISGTADTSEEEEEEEEEEEDEDESDEEEAVIIETATMTRIIPDKSPEMESSDATQRSTHDIPSLPNRTLQSGPPLKLQDPMNTVPTLSERFLSIESPMDASYAPPPLSPRRMPAGSAVPHVSDQLQLPQHVRGDSGNSMSWLDTIDESGGSSCGSSVHSRTREGLYRKHVRMPSGETEAEFDAALDAAVEAAYDDGLEPYHYDEKPYRFNDSRLPEPVKVMVDNERKRLSDREQLIQAAHSRAHELRKSQDMFASEHDSDGLFDDVEEEERMLEEMSKDFGFDFGLQSKAAPPRTSDSSGYSGNTWHSSVSSSRTTALSSLSTVAEAPGAGLAAAKATDLPRLSEEGNQNETLLSNSVFIPPKNQAPSSVRSRRMSGQNAKQLKIETSINTLSRKPSIRPSDAKADSVDVAQPVARSDLQLLPDTVFKPPGSAPTFAAPQNYGVQSSPHYAPSSAVTEPAASATPVGMPLVPSDAEISKAESKPLGPKPGLLKKKKSSISLNTRTLTMSSPDGSEEASIGTPLSTTFSAFSTHSRKAIPRQIDPTPPTPSIVASFSDLPGTTTNINIFESDIHSPFVPGSPNPMAANAPIPLEACPDSHLLRPFWLMRCFYQTIAHPRGGYLSTKLFVPRDVWRVKGVKIKGVEDKIANCDLLTAALQKLASVDTLDADAVLDEMQALEHVLDQVQGNLIKKLSSDVGVQGTASLFKDATSSGGDGSHTSEIISASSRAVSQGKSYLSSWRKLRSKSSAVSLSTSFSSSKDHAKETITLSSLPMTSLPNPRFAKRDVSQLELSGPHAAYMSSLSRLFDAVQIVDQVARQVEDPGLKLSSPTHVGLELCTRHASEFFGFYVCRFVLTDLTMLLDKFIKRGSEWVLV